MIFLRTFIKRITKCLLAQRPISPLFPTWLIMVYVVDSCVAGINVWSLRSWQQPPWEHPAFPEQLLDGTLVNERLQIQLRLPVCSSLHVCLSASSVLSTLCRGRKGAQAPVQMSLCPPHTHTLSYIDHLHRKIVSTERLSCTSSVDVDILRYPDHANGLQYPLRNSSHAWLNGYHPMLG